MLIDMFMRNTWRAVHNRYKELKRQELIWEQFLTEVTVINDEEARWDSSKRKEDDKDKKCPSSSNKRAKASKKKTKNGLSEHAEEFCKELNISKEEYQRCVCERLCLKCGQKGHYVGNLQG